MTRKSFGRHTIVENVDYNIRLFLSLAIVYIES